ncbi:MAG TPA: hypothetical protein VJW76_13850, partial [Verrucomicrobiae bacterium]|nr:hypothetical protein [Verrucomicrobiae bacterium]
TIILKEKFADTGGQKTEMFTGMIKREAGYNSECGDWEFFTMEASGSRIVERGRIRRCMDCHVEYKSRDFVTKNYVSGSAWDAPNK